MGGFSGKPAAKPDLDALRRFSDLTDREATPYFGGRADEIGLVERALNRIRERAREGNWRPAGGETILFQGAPGAGKSALLHHLVRRWRSAGLDAPLVVDAAASDFVDGGVLASLVAQAVDHALAAQFRRSVTTHSGNTKLLRTGVPGVKTGTAAAETSRWEALAPAEPTLEDVMEAVSRSERPVVLILDEAQILEGLDANSASPVISNLHMGSHGGSILPVFAGLAYSGTVLENLGISRFSRGHDRTLSALSFDESVEIVQLMLSECRVQGDEETKRQWAHVLAIDSCGWPQHLHVALQTLATQLLSASTPGRLQSVESDFGNSVLQESASARDEYYEHRIDAPLADALHVLAETMRRIGKAATYKAVLEYIRAAAQSDEGSTSLPQGFNAQKFLDHMIRRGVLQRTPKQLLVCPIPSLKDYIERMAHQIELEAGATNAKSAPMANGRER